MLSNFMLLYTVLLFSAFNFFQGSIVKHFTVTIVLFSELKFNVKHFFVWHWFGQNLLKIWKLLINRKNCILICIIQDIKNIL